MDFTNYSRLKIRYYVSKNYKPLIYTNYDKFIFSPYLMSADVFGKFYVGSLKWRQNQRERKKLAKQQGRN